MRTQVLIHVLISLVGILSGFVVLFGLLTAKLLNRWSAIFLTTTVATSLTGFVLPADRLLPSHTKDTPNPPGGEIQRDSAGNPTGLLIARPNATILYATLAKGPKLPPEHQMNSTRHFVRELNRLGLTSIIDAGGGYQNYPEDYAVIEELHKSGELTLRIAYNLFTQRPRQEKEDFARWIKMTGPGQGDDFLRCNGAGEMLVFSAADFEDFLEPRAHKHRRHGETPGRDPPRPRRHPLLLLSKRSR